MYQKYLNGKHRKVVPPKLEEEKILFCDYAYWLKQDGIVPPEIVAKFKDDSLRMKKENPIYKD